MKPELSEMIRFGGHLLAFLDKRGQVRLELHYLRVNFPLKFGKLVRVYYQFLSYYLLEPLQWELHLRNLHLRDNGQMAHFICWNLQGKEMA